MIVVVQKFRELMESSGFVDRTIHLLSVVHTNGLRTNGRYNNPAGSGPMLCCSFCELPWVLTHAHFASHLPSRNGQVIPFSSYLGSRVVILWKANECNQQPLICWLVRVPWRTWNKWSSLHGHLGHGWNSLPLVPILLDESKAQVMFPTYSGAAMDPWYRRRRWLVYANDAS